MKKIILSLFLLLGSVSVANALDIVDPDYGGVVERYVGRLNAANARNEPIRIGPTTCDSSCTLFLAARSPYSCVSGNAVLGFHAPWYGTPTSGVVNPRMVALFASQYKPGLRKLFLNHVARTKHIVPGPIMHLSGYQLARYGYRLCGE